MESKSNFLWVRLFSLCIIIALGCAVYSNSHNVPFHLDGREHIVENPSIKDLTNLEAIFNSQSQPARFVTYLSFALNYRLGQLSVGGYHLVNTVIHIFNAFFVWCLILLIVKSPRYIKEEVVADRYFIALMASLIFLVHPLQVQAVTYIAQRFTSLATFFYLSTLVFYMLGRVRSKGGKRYFFLAVITAILGMFTKEIVFTLPFMIVLFEFYFFRTTKTTKGAEKTLSIFHILFILAFALIIPALYKFNSDQVIGQLIESRSHDISTETLSSGSYFLTQFSVILTYLKNFFYPLHLNFDYDFLMSQGFTESRTTISFLVLTLVFLLALRMHRKMQLFSFGVMWMFLTLSVESSIIPLATVIQDHRMYLPSVGLTIAFCILLYNLFRAKKLYRFVAVIVISALSVLTYQRNVVWNDRITLWSDIVAKSPDKVRAHDELGLAYFEKGQYTQAMQHYQKAIRLNSRYANTYNHMGDIYKLQQQNDLAMIQYEKAIELDPKQAEFYYDKGLLLKSKGQLDEAFEQFELALELDHQFVEALTQRGAAYFNQGEWVLALSDYNKALIIDPDFPEAYMRRAQLHKSLKKNRQSLEDFARAIQKDARYVAAYNNRGVLLKEQTYYDLALKDLNKAIKIDPRQERIYNNRGIVHEMQGKFGLALNDYSKAIQLNSSYARAYLNRAFLRLKKNEFDQAMEDFDLAIQTGQSTGLSYYYRSMAFYQLKKFDQARRDLDLALENGYQPSETYLSKLQFALSKNDRN